MAAAVLTNPLRPVLLAAAGSSRLKRTVSGLSLSRRLVERFVPGEGEDAVLSVATDLLRSGRYISVDHLGEDTHEPAQAQACLQAYLSLLRAYRELPTLDTAGARPLEVSLKLSALGQFLPDGHAVALENARTVCQAAQDSGVWVNVDAEDHTTTDSTLSIVSELREDFSTVATVLQAYLRRTEADCRDLATAGSRIRLCKGAYSEPGSVAFTKKPEVDDSYRRCLEVLFTGRGYPMVASHDPAMIEAALDLAERTGRAAQDYEFQMLYGIRDEEQRRLVADGRQVRVYTPYGDQWYGYFMRRLAERPANLIFFLRSLVSRS